MPGTRRRCVPLPIALAVSGIVISGVLVSAPARLVTADDKAQPRRALSLGQPERDAITAEMRTMLQSINRILHGLSTGDSAMVKAAARASGMDSAPGGDVRARLPAHFVQLDDKTHRRFDEIANVSEQRDKALLGLAMITGYCVSCHDTYRLEDGRPDPGMTK
jgi:cytochrome c556